MQKRKSRTCAGLGHYEPYKACMELCRQVSANIRGIFGGCGYPLASRIEEGVIRIRVLHELLNIVVSLVVAGC